MKRKRVLTVQEYPHARVVTVRPPLEEPLPLPMASDRMPLLRKPRVTRAQQALLRELCDQGGEGVVRGARIAAAEKLERLGLVEDRGGAWPGRLFRLTGDGVVARIFLYPRWQTAKHPGAASD